MPPPPLHIPARVSDERPRRRRLWPWLFLLLILVFACGAVALAAAGWSYQRDRIMPGVQTLGVPLGGQSIEQASRQLEANWSARRATLQDNDNAISTRPLADLGIMLDSEATARAAYRQGRDLSAPQQIIQSLLGPKTVQPIWYFDPAVARASLASIAPQLEVPAVNAGVIFSDARFQATSPQTGIELDIEATTTWLQQNAVQVAFGAPVPLTTRTVEPEITDVDALVATLNERIGAPIVLRGFDPVSGEVQRTEIPSQTWAGWLDVSPDGAVSAADVSWSVDQSAVAAFVHNQSEVLGSGRYYEVDSATAALAAAIEEERQEVRLRIYHSPRQHTVTSGETLSSIAVDYGVPYPWIQDANPGLGDSLSVGQVITIPSPDELIPLPVVENKRIVVSISQQRMWAYENGELKWEWLVSTGIDSSPTAPGVFQIQSHEPNAYASIWDLWMPQFMGIYRPVPTSDFMNGFHGFPTRSGTNLLWTNSLGRKVTYGCILVSNDNIALLYDWAEEGVIVEVQS